MASIGNTMMTMDSNWSSLLPGRNPTGSTGAGVSSVPSSGSKSGQNPILPPTNIPVGAPAPNPYGGGVIPTFGANTGGGYSPTSLLPGGGAVGVPGGAGTGTGTGGGTGGILSGMSPADLKRLHDELGNTYGNGVAAAIMQFLQGGGGFNQAAVNNIFAGLQPGFERAQENLISQFSTSGNRFGSGAQIGLADLISQEQLNMGEIEAQMYQQSIQNSLDVLMGISKGTQSTLANSPSMMDSLTSILPGIGAGASAASAAGVGGTAGSILDVIGSIGLAFCWVASELYGGWFAPETVAIRGWLLETWYMAPFVALYRRYGKQWAEFIRTHTVARKMTRKLFDVFLRIAR